MKKKNKKGVLKMPMTPEEIRTEVDNIIGEGEILEKTFGHAGAESLFDDEDPEEEMEEDL
jgi:hypothetical protein